VNVKRPLLQVLALLKKMTEWRAAGLLERIEKLRFAELLNRRLNTPRLSFQRKPDTQ
jgi:hypothetical protein